MTEGWGSTIPTDTDESPETVQLLVADAGNRSAIGGMLEGQFDVVTSPDVSDADLYLIEDHVFPEYRTALRERVESDHPAFCPVVLIRRQNTILRHDSGGTPAPDGSVLYDEVIDAPVDPPELIRRLNSLLVRRRQSWELIQHVSVLEEREQRLRLFEQGVESTGNAIVMTDPTGRIEYVNPALVSIAGYTEADILGISPRILLPEGTGEVFDDEFWRTMVDQAEWEGDIIIERKDGNRLVTNTTVTALRDAEDETRGFVIVLSDITERIQREQELENHEVELDLLRQILTRYLRHNLRNSLTVIQGSAALLSEDETLSEGQVKLANTIIENSEDLLVKSDTARTYSSLLEREAELSGFDLSAITTKAVQAVQERFPHVEFEIDSPESCHIRARDGIRRAVEELIDNAARHNDGPDPWVRIQVRDRAGARLVIEDNGPGISEQERNALERGSETQLSHSQGFGLWLSKWVVEGFDGQLSIQVTDSGTRIEVKFPAAETVSSTGLDVTTLKERERRLQTITDRMTDAILEVDGDWKIIRLDERAEKILDVDADAVTGRSLWSMFPDLINTRFEAIVRDAMESRTSTSAEEEFEVIDAWLEINVYPEFDGGLSFYTRDVSERKEREQNLETERRKYESMAGTIPSVIYRADPQTLETSYVNDYIEALHGYSAERWVRNPSLWEESLHSEDRDTVIETFRYYREEERPGDLEYRILRPDGEIRWVRDTFSWERAKNGSITALIGVVSDITVRKEREQALQERVKELSAIHTTTNLFQTVDAPVEELLSVFIEQVPRSFLYPDVAEARLRYNGTQVATADLEALDHVITARDHLEDGAQLELCVGYPSDPRIDADRPFLAEEEKLLVTLVTVVTNYVQRRNYLVNLERTEELLTNAEQLGNVGGWEVDLESAAVFWTDGVRRIFEVTDAFTPTLENTIEFFHPEYRTHVTEAIAACGESGESFGLEARIQTAEGTDRWVHIEGETSGTRDESATVNGYIRDITEQKERTRRYEAIFNQTYQFTGLMETDGTLIEANDAALEFGGVTRADVLGQKIWNTHWFGISEETKRQTRADVRRAAAGEFVRRELEVQGADGRVVIDFSIRPITDDDGAVISLVPEGRDISELKQRERALELEHARFKAVFEDSFDAMVLADDEGRYIEVNESATEMFGVPEEELLGRSIVEFAPAEFDFDAAWSEFQNSERERGTFPLVRPDGTKRYVEYAATMNIIPGQHLSILRDVTERKNWDQELQIRAKQLQDIIDTVEGAIWVRNADSEYVYMNQYHRDIFYIADDVEVAGKQLSDLLPAEVAGQFQQNDQRVYETEEPVEIEETVESDDGPREFLTRIVPLFENGSVYATCGIATDITEQVERERRLQRQRDRLDEFAGVVSHDLRNPLNVANGRLEMAMEECESEHLETVDRSHDRMEELINDMLSLARAGGTISETEAVELSALVDTCWRNVEIESADLVIETDATIQADETRLQQLIENLMRNAVEHGGEDIVITIGDLPGGFYVEDDGPGIPEEVRSKVLVPGYSTSEKGIGFGLTIVKDIVEAHGWSIRLTDRIDGGARFEITCVDFDGV